MPLDLPVFHLVDLAVLLLDLLVLHLILVVVRLLMISHLTLIAKRRLVIDLHLNVNLAVLHLILVAVYLIFILVPMPGGLIGLTTVRLLMIEKQKDPMTVRTVTFACVITYLHVITDLHLCFGQLEAFFILAHLYSPTQTSPWVVDSTTSLLSYWTSTSFLSFS